MYSDQHLHCIYSGDSETPAEDEVNKAVSLGMEHICFTDHHDPFVNSDIDFELDFPSYLDGIGKLRTAHADRIDIGIGLELGLQTHIKDHLVSLSEAYPLDFIIGSIHFVDGLDPYYPEYFVKYGKNAYTRYFETVLENLKIMSCFDSLGHLDYIVRYGKGSDLTYSYEEYAHLIDPILRILIDRGIALECNTGGMSRGLPEPNPCYDIFRRYRQMGGELITLGSDAHDPSTLGCYFEEAGEMLRSIGFTHYAVYHGRKPHMERL